MEETPKRYVKTQHVYDFVYNAIINGKILTGETLTERGIASKLNISRTPVREAFRKLAKDGIIEFEPYKGVRVLTYSKERIKQLYLVREIIERASVRICAEKENNQLIERLDLLHEEAERFVAENKITQLRESNSQFHSELANFTENPYLISTHTNIKKQVNIFMARSLSNKGRPKENIEEHRLIINSLKHQDPDLAEALIKFHLKNSLENVLNNINHIGD